MAVLERTVQLRLESRLILLCSKFPLVFPEGGRLILKRHFRLRIPARPAATLASSISVIRLPRGMLVHWLIAPTIDNRIAVMLGFDPEAARRPIANRIPRS